MDGVSGPGVGSAVAVLQLGCVVGKISVMGGVDVGMVMLAGLAPQALSRIEKRMARMAKDRSFKVGMLFVNRLL